ncbi:MAG: DUF952 domain-containing protein [Candidatus Limnocylindrales bacterium]
MRTTFHLVPASAWGAWQPGTPYAPESLAAEGFIHCTDGADELVATANRHYRDDPRPFVTLLVNLDACGSPWSVADERGVYPHIFGPIDPAAILGERSVDRAADGRFSGLGPLRLVDAPPR